MPGSAALHILANYKKPLNWALYANMNLSFVPQNKNDLEACNKLKTLSNVDLSSHFGKLLPWLQDMNWPVALSVSEKLAEANIEIVPFINEVLAGDDEIWKCNIIEHLIMKLKPDVMESALEEVVRIINSPSKSEIEEGVNLIGREAVFYYSHCV